MKLLLAYERGHNFKHIALRDFWSCCTLESIGFGPNGLQKRVSTIGIASSVSFFFKEGFPRFGWFGAVVAKHIVQNAYRLKICECEVCKPVLGVAAGEIFGKNKNLVCGRRFSVGKNGEGV